MILHMESIPAFCNKENIYSFINMYMLKIHIKKKGGKKGMEAYTYTYIIR